VSLLHLTITAKPPDLQAIHNGSARSRQGRGEPPCRIKSGEANADGSINFLLPNPAQFLFARFNPVQTFAMKPEDKRRADTISTFA
jgi:hypothetical protein